MNRSSVFMLIGAVLLGLLAAGAVWTMMDSTPVEVKPATPQGTIVVAATDIPIGTDIAPQVLRAVPWPAAVPAGAFRRIEDVTEDGGGKALRNFAAGEPILETGISGRLGRLANLAQIGPDMRAMTIAIDEVTGVGGFLVPGDRVDILMTHLSRDDTASATIVAQNLRVLAMGQVQDPGASEPKLVKSLTLEATPAVVQKIALARSIGTLGVMLRGTGNESILPVSVTNTVRELGIRPVRTATPAAAPAAAPAGKAGPVVIRPGGPEVRIVRGTESTSYRVAR